MHGRERSCIGKEHGKGDSHDCMADMHMRGEGHRHDRVARTAPLRLEATHQAPQSDASVACLSICVLCHRRGLQVVDEETRKKTRKRSQSRGVAQRGPMLSLRHPRKFGPSSIGDLTYH